MENHAVVQLKVIAKERGIRGYYKLRKAELIHALEATNLVEQKVTSLTRWFQTIPLRFYNQHIGDHQILRWNINKILKISLQKTCKRQKKFFTMGMQKIKDFGEWLLNYIPPTSKVVDKVLLKTKLKKFMKREIVCSNQHRPNLLWRIFAIQYRIKGSNGYDPESFLLDSKQPVINLMINTWQTKVKLILSCMMEKVDLKRGEVIAKETEVNLESTDSNECFRKWKKLFWSP